MYHNKKIDYGLLTNCCHTTLGMLFTPTVSNQYEVVLAKEW